MLVFRLFYVIGNGNITSDFIFVTGTTQTSNKSLCCANGIINSKMVWKSDKTISKSL